MELFSITLSGYRRFRKPSTLRTNGKLIALLGPNESGKSSLLSAINHIGNGQPLDISEVSRGLTGDDVSISARYLLSDEEALKANLTCPRWMIIEKKYDGKKYCTFYPEVEQRDISHRKLVSEAVMNLLERSHIIDKLESSEENLAIEIIGLFEELDKLSNNLKPAFTDKMSLMRDKLSNAMISSAHPDLIKVLQLWKEMIDKETSPSPVQFATTTLYKLAPDILMFDEDSRNLESSYAMDSLKSSVPVALKNLTDICELDLGQVFSAVDENNSGKIATLEFKANEILRNRFSESWKQSGISVALRIHPDLIEVQVVNERSEFTAFAERSDGLRQFVALQSFAMRARSKSPILLIDEAEQRLHYDAQADLVQMLARQGVSPKVIYTTHSAGCLPEDLGHGVRLVRQSMDDPTSSDLQNKFWAESGNGFSPLLFGMGASTLAFFPTRRAILVEGPGDMLLYPTMFKEVTEDSVLGFQFVPGLSTTGQILAPIMRQQDRNIGYLTDGDGGGLNIRRALVEGGVNEDRIVILKNSDGSAVELEDYVNPTLLLRAANNIINRFAPAAGEINLGQLNVVNRMESLEAAYLMSVGSSISKVELAYEILDILDAEPGSKIIDGRRRNAFEKTVRCVKSLFENPA